MVRVSYFVFQLRCRCFLCNGFPSFSGELLGTCLTTLLSAQASQFYRCWMLAIVFRIINLPCGDIADELRQLDGITRAFSAFHCHGAESRIRIKIAR